MKSSRLLLIASISVIACVGVWGTADPAGVSSFAGGVVDQVFKSRGWFVMLITSAMLFTCVALALSPYGAIRLGVLSV